MEPDGKTLSPARPGRGWQGYALVTPVRNEAATIGTTLESVAGQTRQPREWVVVSDGSTDATDDIVRACAARFGWIRLLRLENRPARDFASAVFALESGVRALEGREHAYLGFLDGDIRLPRDYFERLMGKFDQNPGLGLGGGLAVDVGTHPGPACPVDVAGAVHFYRRECFEAYPRLFAIPEGGWDCITNVCARMSGFETATFGDLRVDHLKPRNAAHGGIVRRAWQFGVRDYALGYHPLFLAAKCLARVGEAPWVVASAARFLGYCQAWAGRRGRVLPAPIVEQVRREQLGRLHLR